MATKIASFRLQESDIEGLKALAELTGETQSTVIRALIANAVNECKADIEAYKKLAAGKRNNALRKGLEALRDG